MKDKKIDEISLMQIKKDVHLISKILLIWFILWLISMFIGLFNIF